MNNGWTWQHTMHEGRDVGNRFTATMLFDQKLEDGRSMKGYEILERPKKGLVIPIIIENPIS